MDKDKKLFSSMLWILLGLSAVAGIVLIIDAAVAGESETYRYLGVPLKIIASIVGVFYGIFKGKKTPGGTLLKAFLWIYAVTLAALFLDQFYLSSIVLIICVALQLAGVIILAAVKDLGERKSKIISIIVVLINFIYLFMMIPAHQLTALDWFGFEDNFLLSIAAYLMINAKYIDKKERGTK